MTHIKQLLRLLLRNGKAFIIQRNSHVHVTAHHKQPPYHLILHRSKTGKTVEYDRASVQTVRTFDHTAQYIQYLLRGDIAALHIIRKLPVNNFDIRKFPVQQRLLPAHSIRVSMPSGLI